MTIKTVGDLIDELSKYDRAKPVKVQDRSIPIIALAVTDVGEDVFAGKEGDVDIILIHVQQDLAAPQD
jgi:ABC-type tungstate transport system permease subunit